MGKTTDFIRSHGSRDDNDGTANSEVLAALEVVAALRGEFPEAASSVNRYQRVAAVHDRLRQGRNKINE